MSDARASSLLPDKYRQTELLLKTKEAALEPRPERGAGHVLFFGAPWRGLSGAVLVQRPFSMRCTPSARHEQFDAMKNQHVLKMNSIDWGER